MKTLIAACCLPLALYGAEPSYKAPQIKLLPIGQEVRPHPTKPGVVLVPQWMIDQSPEAIAARKIELVKQQALQREQQAMAALEEKKRQEAKMAALYASLMEQSRRKLYSQKESDELIELREINENLRRIRVEVESRPLDPNTGRFHAR